MADQSAGGGSSSSDQQPSGFWTLTRPSKLSSKKRQNSDLHELHHKVFNICVVGLSGVEKVRGPIGIGKSCLCNRFVRSAADDYNPDHISILSQSDFGGRVVNNDHWLYWGSVIKSCDGYDLAFNIIEQTEFVDDACFQPFKSSGKLEPYFKRCANTKLVSAEKMMYICKDQLGVEREYEQRYLPDGKFSIDGFLCLFDVSEVQGRNIDKQIELTNLIMLNLIKTRKPIVFATTKHDEANELLVAEAERLINQREFRDLVPIVETSAQENVNVNMAFLVCAQLIDRTRSKLRVPPYFEAHKNHQELLNAASDAYFNLIRSTVMDFRTSWQQVCIKLSHNPEFLQYTYLHGFDKATIVFKTHINLLREECVKQRVQIYLKLFPDVLNELVPRNSNNIDDVNSSDTNIDSNATPQQSWEAVKEQLKSHPSFDKFFIAMPPDISWQETELLQSADTRIPSDWLDSDEAYTLFRQRTLHFETEKRRHNTKELFAQTLSNLKIPVGKPFVEVKHMFTGNYSLEILSDQELFEIYVEYQNNLLQRARADFQELLLENAEHLNHLTSSDKVIRQEDIKTINAILQHDDRYQALDRFDQDRTLMMIRHLSFLHSQISEQCPSYPKCVEPEIERLLITKAKTLVSRYYECRPEKPSTSLQSQKSCDLIIFGPRRPSQQLILALNVLNSRAPKTSQYQITFTVFDNADEIDLHIQRFRKSDTKPKGCFGIFTNQRSLDHVRFTLEKFLILNSQAQNDKNHFGSPPIVMLYAADITLDERTMLALENEGQQMADRFKCPFMNVTAIDQYRQHQQNNILSNDQDSTSQVMSECASLDYACVDAAFNVLKEAVSRRVCFMELYNNQDLIPRQAFNPDARILMCLLCGEPFSNELFLWKMFLDFDNCYVTSSKSICLKVRMDDGQDKFIEITITSYTHGALTYREELLHGFILVCSIERKASLSILNAFSFNIPCIPVLVMAIKSNENKYSYGTTISSEDSKLLIEDAQVAARRLKGHFELFDFELEQISNSCGLGRIKTFLHSVIKRKPIIEQAYELDDSDITLSTPSEFIADKNLRNIDQAKISEKTALAPKYKSEIGSNNFNQAANGVKSRIPNEDVDPYQVNQLNLSTSRHTKRTANRFMKSSANDAQQISSVTITNEIYARRPLPPIPSNVAIVEEKQYEYDRDAEAAPINSAGHRATKMSTAFRAKHCIHLPCPSVVAEHRTNAVNDEFRQRNNLSTAMTTVVKAPIPTPRKIHGLSNRLQQQQQQNISQLVLLKPDACHPPPRSSILNPFLAQQREMSKFQQTSFSHKPLANNNQGNLTINNQLVHQTGSADLQANEEPTNDSASEDNDTEDSTDQKLERPKPGKLDLSQFNNITTAIGKLNIQPPMGTNAKLATEYQGIDPRVSSPKQENAPQESGFFKSRAKKTKNNSRTRESVAPAKQHQDVNDTVGDDHIVSFKITSRDRTKTSESLKSGNQEKTEPSGSSTEISFIGRKPSELSNSKSSSNVQPPCTQKLETKDRSSRLKASTSVASTIKGSSFGQDQSHSEAAKTKAFRADNVPKPAPRSVSQLTSAAIAKSSQQPQQQSPSMTPSSFAGVKRINNPRQNHGRAVAPPQLPSLGRKFDDESGGSSSDIPLAQRVEESVARQQLVEDSSIDFNQSPITQRLLKNSKDYKVSEINSPYESDSDHTPTGVPKLQKFTRGQSFGSETTNTSNSPASQFMSSSIDSTELATTRGATIKQLNEILANKQPLGRLGGPQHLASRGSSLDQQDQSLNQSSAKKGEKDSKKDKKKLRDDEKLEKRRLKEEERLRRQEKKLAAKKSKSSAVTSSGSVGDDGVPLFIRRCIEFIEHEGLDAEGIYRVPGNRAHVDAFVQKFKENSDMSIAEADIPVNAVATALKDFLSKKWGPIIPLDLMDELTELSNISEKEQRVKALRELVNKLPQANYKLLRFVFSHFVKVSLNCSLNSMDSKNLAICWWPTLLPLHFNDMVMFEQMRPHLEESIQTMIDQFDFIFENEECGQ